MRPPAASTQRPLRSCVIASTPRTGSTLLCSGLTQTGSVGRPDEYISISVHRRLAAEWGYPPSYEPATTRVAQAMERTTTANGFFALQAHWFDFALLLRTILNTAGHSDLPDHVDRLLVSPRYVHLSRRDTAAQALSYYRAIYTGVAQVHAEAPSNEGGGGPEPVLYEQVKWLENLLIDWDAQWQAYFARCDIRPLEIFYEDLAAAYGPTVERVLDFLDLTSALPMRNLGAPYRKIPSDWTNRHLDEYRTARARLAPQAVEDLWSREDRIFEIPDTAHSGVPAGNTGTSASSFLDDDVVYSCVVDKPPLLVYQSLIWVLTLTRLARRAPEQLVVHAVEGTPPDHLVRLRSLGVRVIPVERFDERNVYANKLRQLTTGALSDARTAVLCDCDIAFAGDISTFVRGADIGGRTVGTGFPTMDAWRQLLAAAGLTREPRLARSVQTLVWTCAQNLNGGLLVIPGRFHDLLAEAWPRWFGWVLDHTDELADDVNRFAGQVSFGLSLIELDLPVERLPVLANFPLARAEASPFSEVPPLAFHYHSDLTRAGRIRTGGRPAVDDSVAKVNALLDEPQSREIVEVALHNWQATLEPVTSRWGKLKPRWLVSSR